MVLQAACPLWLGSVLASFSSLSPAEQDMLLHSRQHWYIFSSLCKTVLSCRWVSNRHKATTQSHDQRVPPGICFAVSLQKNKENGWPETYLASHYLDVRCYCHDMCILKKIVYTCSEKRMKKWCQLCLGVNVVWPLYLSFSLAVL